MRKFFQIKLIRRYLLSYMIIFLLPLIIMGGLIHFYFQRTLQEELIRNHQASLEKLQSAAEAEVSKFQLTVKQLTLNGYAAPFDLKTNPVKGIHLIQFLNSCKNINPFLSDIVIYYRESNLFYSSNSSYTPKYFYSLYKSRSGVLTDLSPFFDKSAGIHTMPPSISIPSNIERQNNIIMIYPLSISDSSRHALLFFLYSEDKLQKLCRQYYDPSITTVLLTNKEGELLSVFGGQKKIVLDHYRANTGDTDGSSYEIQKIEKEDYLITTSHSPAIGWSYITYTKVDTALATSIHFRYQQLYFMILAVLFGGLLISLCMYYNFLPLYHLIDLSSRLPEARQEPSRNELDRITNTLSRLSSENSLLNATLDRTKTASKEYLIGQLITGHAMKREFLEASLLKTIFSPHYDHYAIFIIQFNTALLLTEDMKLELIQKIEDFSNKDIAFLCKEGLSPNTFITIALMNHHMTAGFPGILSSLKSSLYTAFNNNPTCGAGNIYDLLENLSKSYMEACTALDYRFIKGSDDTILFSNIESIAQGNISSYPYDKIQQFRLALSRGNTKELEQSLNEISSCLSRNDITLFQAKSICQDVINIVTKAIPEDQETKEGLPLYPNTFSISQFDSVSHIIDTVHQLSYDICKRINSSYDADNQILIENVRDFINEKCYDCSFSLQMLSDRFHIAGPNLSAFYKEHTGENIFETVTRLRMERARLLLSTTSLSINQISLTVGYDNTSSFIRRFKQLYHTPPGAWREMHQIRE